MTEPLPGYRSVAATHTSVVTEFKRTEERLLRQIEATQVEMDPRWLAIAKTHLEQGFMALNRSVLQQMRIKLPEDERPYVGPPFDPPRQEGAP